MLSLGVCKMCIDIFKCRRLIFIEMKLLKKIIDGVWFRIETRLLGVFAFFDYLRSNKNVYAEPSVCAFYQCYKNPKSVIAVIDSFRSMYPTSKIFLFCNQGLDMSHIATYFNCEYKYITRGNDSGFYFLNKEDLFLWMQRLIHTAQNSTEDFLIILEDDVRVVDKVRKLKFDLNEIKENHKIGRDATTFLKKRNTSIPSYVKNMYYGGCGGTLINRNFIVANFSNDEKLKNALDEIILYKYKNWGEGLPADAFLTMLVLYFGGTVGRYPGFTEVHFLKYKLKPFLGKIEIVHNDKSLYNLLLSEEENKIFLGQK